MSGRVSEIKQTDVDILVIGSGIAGLTFALKAAELGSVHVITKKDRAVSSTNYAQGGIAAVFAQDDSTELHVRDTLIAGAGLCHLHAVQMLVAEGPARIRDLIEWGVRFTREAGELSLGREGGHTKRRILHAGDLTGREIERALLQAVAEHPRIRLFEDLQAVDLTTATDTLTGVPRCTGALVLEHRTGQLHHFRASLVFLASGGLGEAFRHTTNPEIATGDGVAMAYRAGVAVANLEFVQFHPTALYPARDRAFLISEAVRGEGAILRRLDGTSLMEGVHPLGSLAPRDVVARTIDLALKATGDPYVLLDLSPISREHIEKRFPGILHECRERGVDILREPIPVVPAAHYSCGGVLTDADAATSLPGLLAAGEVACTGVHGANRLASNSLLEAVVYSHRAALCVPRELASAQRQNTTDSAVAAYAHTSANGGDGEHAAAVAAVRRELSDLMWEHAGIARSDERLVEAERTLAELSARSHVLFQQRVDTASIELRNLVEVSTLIVSCARWRQESRGLHYNVDYPHRDNERFLRDTIMRRGQA